MEKSKSPLGLIFFTLFMDMIGFGIVIPVLPLYAEGTRFGATAHQLAWIVGIYSLLQVFCAPLLGRLSDRYGRRPVLILSITGTALGFFIMGSAQTVAMLMLGRIIDGISGGNISTAMACIADSTTRENRSKSMGLVGAAFGLGFVIGPALGGWLSRFGVSVPFYFAGVLALVNAVLVLLRLPETLTPEARARAHDRASVAEVFSKGRAGTVVIILLSQLAGVTGFSVMTSLFALYCHHRLVDSAGQPYDAAHVGYILAYVGIIGAVMQGGVLRRLLHRPIEKQLAVLGTILLAGSMAMLSSTYSLGAVLLVCAGISIGNSLSTPTLNGLASRLTDPHCQGRLMGLMQSAGGLGRFLGPALGFGLVEWDSVAHYGRVPFLASAILLALDAVLLATLRVPAPVAETSDAEPIPEV
jgi:MFS transporter, DHA1 family, tetracycline resistance protein